MHKGTNDIDVDTSYDYAGVILHLPSPAVGCEIMGEPMLSSVINAMNNTIGNFRKLEEFPDWAKNFSVRLLKKTTCSKPISVDDVYPPPLRDFHHYQDLHY